MQNIVIRKKNEFPTLSSPDKKIDGMLMSNIAIGRPLIDRKTFVKTEEERKKLKEFKSKYKHEGRFK